MRAALQIETEADTIVRHPARQRIGLLLVRRFGREKMMPATRMASVSQVCHFAK